MVYHVLRFFSGRKKFELLGVFDSLEKAKRFCVNFEKHNLITWDFHLSIYCYKDSMFRHSYIFDSVDVKFERFN